MAIVTISAQPGLRAEEIARQTATLLSFELITQSRLETLYASEFSGAAEIPARGYADVVTSILARLGREHHLVFCGRGGEHLCGGFPGLLRVRIVAPAAVRAGMLIVEQGLERAEAVRALQQLEREEAAWLRRRFRRISAGAVSFDLALNVERSEERRVGK